MMDGSDIPVRRITPDLDDERHEPDASGLRSLFDDVGSFFEDAGTYIQAETRYQKTRIRFTGMRLKYGLVYAAAAFAFFFLALIALVVGLVIALAPHVTIWGAIAIVFGGLLIGGIVLTNYARKQFVWLASAYKSSEE